MVVSFPGSSLFMVSLVCGVVFDCSTGLFPGVKSPILERSDRARSWAVIVLVYSVSLSQQMIRVYQWSSW